MTEESFTYLHAWHEYKEIDVLLRISGFLLQSIEFPYSHLFMLSLGLASRPSKPPSPPPPPPPGSCGGAQALAHNC